jgi:outer membrane protein assembly factor BamE (lipoprotein component of BamABCDE complex)
MRLPRVQFTVGRMMVMVAIIGVTLGLAQWLNPLATIYSAGYSESRFRRLRVGMSPQQVEAVIGPPLAKAPWGNNTVNWIFSDGAGEPSPFYWRRWVIFEGDKVTVIASDIFSD